MDNLSKKGVTVNGKDLKNAIDVEAPLKAALADNMRNVLVPALESISGQLVQQIGLPPPTSPDQFKLFQAISQQLANMTAKVDSLTNEVQALRTIVSDQAAAAACTTTGNNSQENINSKALAQQTVGGLDQIRNDIDMLISKGKYEEAFTKAVATTTPMMAVYCCSRSDLGKVLQGASTALLSQPILICLMQQLSAALVGTQSAKEFQIELAWLQEIALTMNPQDASIQQHVPKVLKQLVANVNARLVAEGDSGQFRRPLQMLLQILRGMEMG